jgi:DNA-binding protein H-NS
MTRASNTQIQKLEKQLAALKKKEASKQVNAQKRAMDRILKIAKDAGMSPADLVAALGGAKGKSARTVKAANSKKSSRAGVKVAPKYRDPSNPSQTWTGRGKSPAWVLELKSAGKLDAALIK